VFSWNHFTQNRVLFKLNSGILGSFPFLRGGVLKGVPNFAVEIIFDSELIICVIELRGIPRFGSVTNFFSCLKLCPLNLLRGVHK